MDDLSAIRKSIDKEIQGKTFRRCSKCYKYKILEQFPKSSWCAKGHRKTCKTCGNRSRVISRKKYKDKNPFYRQENTLRYKYGITISEYRDMLKLQDCKCAICGKLEKALGKTLSVDHCHKTGKIRQLLCHNCNAGIGFLKEDLLILKSAIKYIRKHSL